MLKIEEMIARLRIPKNTPYCHDNKMKPCPYWDIYKHVDHDKEEVYVCKYLKLFDEKYSLLWDQCKECGINDDFKE